MSSVRFLKRPLLPPLVEWSALLVLLCAVFLPVLKWMVERWSAADSYTSHGFLVPLVSAYFVYRERDTLAKIPRNPSLWGVALFVAGLILFALGGILRVYFTSGLAFVLCVAGMLWYWGGWNWLRQLWFPVVFLLFMLPLPEIAIARMNLALKLLVTKAAVGSLELFGVPIVMDGAKLHLEKGDLVVGDVCSGLRSLLSLVALGVLFAYGAGRNGGWWVRGALLAVVAPAAIFANMLRIDLNILFVHFWGSKPLFEPLFTTSLTGGVDLHLLSGIFVFVFALLILHVTLIVAERWAGAAEPRPAPRATGTVPTIAVVPADSGAL